MDNVIGSWKMKRYLIEGDGNCCFVAVAVGLQRLAAITPASQPNSLHSIQAELGLHTKSQGKQQLMSGSKTLLFRISGG